MLKRIVYFFLLFFGFEVVADAGHYQFHLDIYNKSVIWNTLQHRGIDYDSFNIARNGSTYTLRIYQDNEPYGSDITGTFSGGGNIQNRYLGSYFTGYDAEYDGNVTIFSAVTPVNPAVIAFAGNDAYFTKDFFFTEFPGYNSPGVCWAGMMVSINNGYKYFVGTGDCYDMDYPYPTPSPTSTPTLSPSPTPSPSPTSTVSPSSSPSPNPSWTPENYPSPIPQVGTLTGSIELNTNGSTTTGVFTASIDMPDQEQLSPYFQSGQAEENKINEIENGAYDAEVPDVGQLTELEWTWLDSLLSALSNHPIIAVLSGSSLTASGEVCELSCVIWGKTIYFSFCDWAWFFDDLGYFVLAFAVFYSVQIVFLYNR